MDTLIQKISLTEEIPGYKNPAKSSKFDKNLANNAIGWIEKYCTFSQGTKSKQSFLLEPWQRSVVSHLFGYIKNGIRQYRECFFFVPRKNGKSELAAAIVCYVLFSEPEPGAKLYSAAAKRDQCKHVFDPVKKMIQNHPSLKRRAKIYRNSILVGDRCYSTVSSEAVKEHGGSTHLAIIDELHAQPNRELVDCFETSTGARRQPLLIYLTTSDYDRISICNLKYDYACKVRDGIIEDDTLLPVIYEASKEDDWTDEEVWKKANPNLGVSISTEYFANQCEKAKNDTSFENVFKRLNLNIKTEQAYRWMKMEEWDGCDGPLNIHELRGRICYAGLDLATVRDMSSLVLAFPVDDLIYLLPFYWCPSDTAEIRERKDRQPYVTWAKHGHLDLTPGRTIQFDHIKSKLLDLSRIYNIKKMAYDPFNAASLIQDLENHHGFKMEKFRQGVYSMNAPMRFLMQLVLDRKLVHGGHPILRWNVSNLAAYADSSDNMRPDKEHSNEKIDGIVAGIMAIGLSMQESFGSVYDDRGLVFL